MVVEAPLKAPKSVHSSQDTSLAPALGILHALRESPLNELDQS